MRICPNLNDPQVKASWDAITNDPELGRFEAMREFIEAEKSGRAIGTPDEVKAKLKERNTDQEYRQARRVAIDTGRLIVKSNDPVYTDPDTLMGLAILSNPDSKSLSVATTSNTRAMEILKKLSNQTGIDYEFVTPEQAIEITANAKNPYNVTKGPAFFYGETVYFVGTGLTSELAFHEFSHPLVKAIQNSNPALFQKLYDSALAADPSLLQEAFAEYADFKESILDEKDPEVRQMLEEKHAKAVAEEVLVKALTKAAMLKESGKPVTTGFKKFIDDLLYAIKQFLRKTFGQKSSVSKLDVDTTLDDLAEMLVQGGNFEITTENVKESDVVSYFGENLKYLDDLKKATENKKNAEITFFINKMYEGAKNQIRLILKNKNYQAMVDLFADEYNRGDLQSIRDSLKKHAIELEGKTQQMADDIENTQNELQALVDSVLRLEVMMDKMKSHLEDLQKDPDNQDNIHKAYYYSHVLSYWQQFIKEGLDSMKVVGVESKAPIIQLLDGIKHTMEDSEKIINKMAFSGVADVLWEQWQTPAERAEELFKNMITRLKGNNTSQVSIDKRFIEFYGMTEEDLKQFNALKDKMNSKQPLTSKEKDNYETFKKNSLKGMNITKEKIQSNLKGEGMDAHWANSYLEGYMYNTDPVIGGFAMYYKNNIAEMENRVQARYNEIAKDLDPAMKAAGVNSLKIGELGKMIGFIDKIGTFNPETKQFEEKDVWTLLNPYKDYRYDLDKFNHDVNDLRIAYIKSGSDEDQKALYDKIAERAAHMRKYFQQEYVDAYYEKDDYFEKDAVGKRAAGLRKQILDKIGEITHSLNTEYDVLKANDLLAEEWRKYRLLHSLYYPNGDKKTNSYTDASGQIHYSDTAIEESPDKFNIQNDLAIAERLKEYRDYTRNFREPVERKGVFQESYKKFEAETRAHLIQLNYKPGSVEFDDMLETYLDEWLKLNTRVSIKPEFYQLRNKIIADIQEIFASVGETLKSELAVLRKKPNSTDIDIDRINELESRIKFVETRKKAVDFTDSWKTIHDTVSGYRDDDGQPIGNEIPEGRRDKVKKAQEEMENARTSWSAYSGLTKAEQTELEELYKKREKTTYLNATDYARLTELRNIKDDLGLSTFQRDQLAALFADLRNLQTKQATEYYMDAMNSYLNNIDTKDLFKELGIKELNAINVEKLYTPKALKYLFEKSPDFEEWFTKNHIAKEIFDVEQEKKVTVYERLYVWNVVKPVDPSFYESTQITKQDGSMLLVPGLPKMKYYAQVVKKKYRTGYNQATDKLEIKVGVQKDNQGMFLPKTKEQMIAYRAKHPEQFTTPDEHLKYVNEEYFKLEKENSALFKVLEIITKHHLKTQEGLGRNPKLYLDFPRFEKSNLEWAQTGGFGRTTEETGSKFSLLWKRIKDFFQGYQADVGSVLNYDEKLMLVRANAFGNEIDDIPIQGLFNLDTNETSTDIVTSMLTYMSSAENHKQLVKMNPVATALKKVLNDPDNYQQELNKISAANFLSTGSLTFTKNKDKYVRKEAYNNMYEREFLGKTQTGAGSNNALLQNLQNGLFKMASFSFFALNIPSALKNAMSAKYQAFLHSVSDVDMNPSTMIKGEVWSTKYMGKLSFGDAYASGQKSLEHQIGEIFDPVQGRFREKFSESITRTMGKDIASMSWLSNFRKWTEVQAGMQTFAGMMYKKTIKRAGKEIDYMDAWELNSDGQIVLKSGIDVRYNNLPTTYTVAAGDTLSSLATKFFMSSEDLQKAIGKKTITEGTEIKIDNTEFKAFRTRVHTVMNKLNGAYAKFDQPEMQRYMAFRYVSYLRRYFTTMAINRFGKKRWNPGYGDIDEGYYVTAVKSLGKIASTRGFHQLSPEDKKSVMKVMVEVGSLYMMSLLVGLLWDWDDDDEERFEKLRARSGHMGFLGLTSENRPGEDFNLGGFMSLHAMNLMMQVRAENEQMVPLPGYGLGYMNRLLDFKSMAFGPTFDTYGKIATDISQTMSGDDKRFYKRRVGPYEWQDKEGRKLWAHLAKMAGLTGSSIDPAQAITNWKNAQNRFN
jgi:hypothetical protein